MKISFKKSSTAISALIFAAACIGANPALAAKKCKPNDVACQKEVAEDAKKKGEGAVDKGVKKVDGDVNKVEGGVNKGAKKVAGGVNKAEEVAKKAKKDR